MSFDEAATVFDDLDFISVIDEEHSKDEERYITLGLSKRGRLLVVAHTDRNGKVRLISLTTVSPGYMVVVCEGRRGEGFFICGDCGAGFRSRKEFLKGHDTPQGYKCSAKPETLRNVSLGHELVTDVLKIQFSHSPSIPIEEPGFAFSLAYAMVEGAAEILGVPSNDLNATIAYGSESYSIPPIILYDNVPGGAGLVARLEEKSVLRDCLGIARKRVSGACGCGENDSCYGCLRSYRNQFTHQYLQRGPVLYYLEEILAKWA